MRSSPNSPSTRAHLHSVRLMPRLRRGLKPSVNHVGRSVGGVRISRGLANSGGRSDLERAPMPVRGIAHRRRFVARAPASNRQRNVTRVASCLPWAKPARAAGTRAAGSIWSVLIHFIPPAMTRVHEGGGLAARTPGVLTMHATSRTTGVGATDSRDERGPRGSRERWTDGQLRAGFPGDRPDAGRGRWRQGRAPRGAFADRRRPRAGWLLRDDGRLPADHGGRAVDRRTARSAVAPEPG